MVGRLASFWDGFLAGAMLVSGSVTFFTMVYLYMNITQYKFWPERKSHWSRNLENPRVTFHSIASFLWKPSNHSFYCLQRTRVGNWTNPSSTDPPTKKKKSPQAKFGPLIPQPHKNKRNTIHPKTNQKLRPQKFHFLDSNKKTIQSELPRFLL